jgi:tripartite-type tricarboxylate transporter receptor subunit TctC
MERTLQRYFLGLIGSMLLAMATAMAQPTPPAALAQPYPSKPVRIIVPFPPGGYTDATARIIAQSLTERLGQPFVVDNRPGASTVIGAEAVARAQPDGYTLLFTGSSTFTVNPVLLHNLPYDPLKSFVMVGIVTRTPMVLLVNPSFPASSVKELVALASASPGKYAYGSFGAGTISHFAGEAFSAATGARLLHVPYKGSAPLMNDLVGGQVPISFDTLVVAAPQIRAGKVRALAVLTKDRTNLFPQLPTVAESGYPGFDLGTWVALSSAAGTPEAVIQKLREEVTVIVSQKDVIARFDALGVEGVKPTAEEFSRNVQADLQRYAKIARDADIKGE